MRINENAITNANNILVENAILNSDFTPAFIKAAKILATAIPDDYPLKVIIEMGKTDDFSATDGSEDVLAKTTSNFVLNNYNPRNPNTSSPDRERNSRNKLIPKAMANREMLSDVASDISDIVIKLNPDIDFYTDTLNANPSIYQYDLVTVILREMVVGCGFRSSFSIHKITPNTVLLSNKYLANNGAYYPNLWDHYLFNRDGVRFSDVSRTSGDNYYFLDGQQLFFAPSLYSDEEVEMLNELSYSSNISDISIKSTNTVLDTTDLMTGLFYAGSVIRSVTPATKSILENLGWKKDIITSLRYRTCEILNFFPLGTTEITERLQPNVEYKYRPDIDNWGDIQFFELRFVKSDGSFYTIAQSNSSIGMLNVLYSTLPNYEWQREPGTGNIIGYIFFQSYNPNNGTNDVYFNGFKKVYLAYPPTSASLNVKKMNATSTTIDADISYSSKGATSYKINYSTSGDPNRYVVEIPRKEDVRYFINNLPKNRKTSFYITAINTNGSVNSPTETIGDDPISTLAMVLTKSGTRLKYRFKSGSQYITNLTINSVAIYDRNGVLQMTTSAGINEMFSIAALNPGYYILKVDVAEVTVFSKMFVR